MTQSEAANRYPEKQGGIPRIILRESSLALEGGQNARTFQGDDGIFPRLLSAVLTRSNVHWMEGFVLFPTWQRGRQTSLYESQFQSRASKAASFLRSCLGCGDSMAVRILKASKRSSAFTLKATVDFSSNIQEATALLDEAATKFRLGERELAWVLLWQAFEKVPDRTLIRVKSLVTTMQCAPTYPSRDVSARRWRPVVEGALHGHQQALGEAIMRVIGYAYAGREEFKWHEVQPHLRDWCREFDRITECLAMMDVKPQIVVRGDKSEIVGFVQLANRYLTMCRDLPTDGSEPELKAMQRERDDCLAELEKTPFVVAVVETVVRDFADQPHQRTKFEDVRDVRSKWLDDFVKGHVLGLQATPHLLVEAVQSLRRHARAERTNLELADIEKAADTGELTQQFGILWKHLTGRKPATAALKRFLSSIPRTSRQRVVSDPVHEALTFLRKDSDDDLRQRLHRQPIDGCVRLELLQPMAASTECASERWPANDSHHRTGQFVRCTIDQLLQPRSQAIVCAGSGSGKTTILKLLQHKHAREDAPWLAVYVPAMRIARGANCTWDGTKQRLVAYLRRDIARLDWATVIDQAERTERLALLIDHPEDVAARCPGLGELAAQLASMPPTITLIVAARPTAAEAFRPYERFQRYDLQPFDDEDILGFFGLRYDQAKAISRGDQELLRTPLLAFLLRSLLIKRENKPLTITSRWELYEAILSRLLHEHAGRGRANVHQWIADVETLMGAISYGAIERTPPLWHEIPNEVHTSLARRTGIAIDFLPAAGFAELVAGRGPGHGSALVFAHRSFQEYYAARWAWQESQWEALLRKQAWDPRWHEVIRFLADKGGDAVIEAIYPGPESDDALHSRLFLAARCAHPEKTARRLMERITDDLFRLKDQPVFQWQALSLLMHVMNINEPAETVPATPPPPQGLPLPEFQEPPKPGKEHESFTQERLACALDNATPESDLRAEAVQFLIDNAAHIPREKLPRLVERLPLDNIDQTSQSAGLCAAIADRLEAADLAWLREGIADFSTHNPHLLRHIQVVRYLRRRLTGHDLDRLGLAECADKVAEFDLDCRMRAPIRNLNEWLSIAFNKQVDAEDREHFQAAALAVVSQCCQIAEEMNRSSSDYELKTRCGTIPFTELKLRYSARFDQRMLLWIGQELDQQAVSLVLRGVEHPILRYPLLVVAAGAVDKLGARERRKLLDLIANASDEDRGQLVSGCFEMLADSLEKNDIERALAACGGHDGTRILRSLLAMMHRLKKPLIGLIVDWLLAGQNKRHAPYYYFESLAQQLSREHQQRVVSHIEKTNGSDRESLRLLDPRTCNSEDLAPLVQLLDHPDQTTAERVYWKLQDIRDTGTWIPQVPQSGWKRLQSSIQSATRKMKLGPRADRKK